MNYFNNTNYSQNLLSNPISKEELEKAIFQAFPVLSNKTFFHQMFSSYDFHEKENNMVEFWYNLLTFLYKDIFKTFGMNISKLLNICRIQNKTPIGLKNILVKLNNENKFITDKDINNINYYKKYFQNIYPDSKPSWGTYLKNGISSIFNYAYYLNENIEEKDDYIYEKNLNDNYIYLNYNLFIENCEDLFNFLFEILRENDMQVILKKDFNEYVINNKELKYGNLYFDLCLIYLDKIKKISIFKIQEGHFNLECIKLLTNINDTVNDKDKTIIKIILSIEKVERKIVEIEKIINDLTEKAKNCLKANDRKRAINFLKKRKMYERYYQNSNNIIGTFNQKLLDIKQLEINKTTKDILENTIKISNELNTNLKEYDEIALDLKEEYNKRKEINDIISEYGNMGINEDEINMEMEQLQNENQENMNFPNPGNNIIYDKGKNPNMNDTLDNMLEDLNK